jgi:hypothetical protein
VQQNLGIDALAQAMEGPCEIIDDVASIASGG